jgi:thiol-disulfide isomerase/thioredoxin
MDRFLLFGLIAGGLGLGYLGLRRWQLYCAAKTVLIDPLLRGLRPGVPTVVYFTSPECGPCRFQQEPALDRLRADLGEHVQVIEINALEDTEAATRWGVLSVPTTFVLDPQGQPRAINYGVAGAEKLRAQVSGRA